MLDAFNALLTKKGAKTIDFCLRCVYNFKSRGSRGSTLFGRSEGRISAEGVTMEENVHSRYPTFQSFRLFGEQVFLSPLSFEDIDDRVNWNTNNASWKKLDDPNYVASTFDEIAYRLKKKQEIERNTKYIGGIYTSLEIRNKEGVHIGFINCYPYPDHCLIKESAAVGVIIPVETCRGHGWGTEAVNLYCNYLFSVGIKQLYLITHSFNQPMVKVAAKCGFMEYRHSEQLLFVKQNSLQQEV